LLPDADAMIPEILPPTEDKFIDADIGGAVAACSGFFARPAERAVLIALASQQSCR
jgi:hypothetical protein